MGVSTVNPGMRWVRTKISREPVMRLEKELKCSRLTSRLLCARGLQDPAEAYKFLYPNPKDLHDPFLLIDMDKAVEGIKEAISLSHKICVYGDYDVDGTTSTVILLKAIRLLGGDVSHYIPKRLTEGYGLNIAAVSTLADKGYKLIISVDTGIRAHEAVEYGRGRGLGFIITDHHLPEDSLPNAMAILNPKRQDCNFPDRNLAGVGVAFKLVQALLSGTEHESKALSFAKVAAIGTVADIVPLTGENRIIVKLGLEGLANVRNHGLKALLKLSGIEGAPSSTDIAFRVGPRINAMGRMGSADPVIALFNVKEEGEALMLAADLTQQNQIRQVAQESVVEAAVDMLGAAEHQGKVLVLAGNGWHKGVVGIAASKIVELKNRPVVMLSVADGVAVGSARSIQGFHMLDALEWANLQHSGLLKKFGGHAHAAGMTLPAENIDILRDLLNLHANGNLNDDHLVPTLRIDHQLSIDSITYDTIVEINALAPFGMGNPEPVFACRAIVLAEPKILKGKHLKLRLGDPGGYHPIDALWWGVGDSAGALKEGLMVDIAFTIEQSEWLGQQRLQLIIRDLYLVKSTQA